ncbi:T9SS type B sorting domain-containing protein [Flavobacterium sp. NG2]|uniref:T9SS type B sorting domain-containing protein n=1 Tax=Flavobacterium sp. NG2 TaxID=3097547 RepID=UPI002A83D994|nr:T9SS type B sorting domain-containing protein [Flavobacterium sp. NG2]WPR70220.1 T9SS type B sorting domain-containing protein [Flavobacterium sp. NG2]
MKKKIHTLSFLSLIFFCCYTGLFASSLIENANVDYVNEKVILNSKMSVFNHPNLDVLAPPAPVVNSPIYYCQNSVASPLTATALSGHTLIWYGTAATGGIPTTTAPTPSTNSVGTTTYYVSQTDGTAVSPRASIVVNVVADNGSKILLLRCDPTQIAAADKYSSVYFDWTNTLGLPNQYTYFYTVNGGPAVNGTTGPSNLQVFGLSPGQSVTLTLWHTTYPCDRSVITCTVPCSPTTVNPNFAPIPPICSGSVAPVLGPTSPNGISGTWSPAVINNTTSGSYVFTPNPVLFPCASTQTLNVTVLPVASPVFNGIPSTVCQNTAAPVLPTSSNNTPPITGTWTPSTVNTAVLGPVTYTFNPNPGQCVTASPTTVTITVIPNNVTPTFNPVGPICSGDALAPLPTTSNNGITGTWTPAINNTTTTTYTFTPTPGQCALNTSMTITVNPRVNPTFTAVSPICSGGALAALSTTSNNGYTGSWSPAIDNTKTTTYTFTPDAGQCSTIFNMTIIVNPIIEPNFSSVPSVVCENSGNYVLPAASENTPQITGTWSPSFVDSSVLGTTNYVFTPDAGQCASSKTLAITVKPTNNLVDFQWTVSDAFAENQIVTINATLPDDYLYQMDFGPLQSSPIFENVSYGLHTVTVIDPAGCSFPITKSNILVVDFPRFFTPNGDGLNDSWNIVSLKNDINAKINVFDRYGKLLAEIRPNGAGWNGYYNGNPMPATDYWFQIDYVENNVVKKFRSHFSLKR